MSKKGKGVRAKERRAGWFFLMPATIMICIMSFWPMIQAFITSFKSGKGAQLSWADPWNFNYSRILQDKIFITSLKNTFLYLIIEVPIMLILAILLAQILNDPGQAILIGIVDGKVAGNSSISGIGTKRKIRHRITRPLLPPVLTNLLFTGIWPISC